MNYDALSWCIWKRRAHAEALHRKDPALLASARSILANITGARWNRAKVEGREWLTEDEVVKRLVAIGPGVLSSVFDDLGPNTISGQDRSPYVKVIEQVGSVQDTPILIDTLALVVSSWEQGHTASPVQDQATVKAIHECLEKLTGARSTETSHEGRVEFWAKWWEQNAKRVIPGKANR